MLSLVTAACADVRAPTDGSQPSVSRSTARSSHALVPMPTGVLSATAAASVPAVASAVASAAVSAAVPLTAGGKGAVKGRWGMVSSEDPLATRIGVAMLEQGGNAIDAAVAVGYALSVTHHAAGSLGGGGFMLIQLAGGEVVALDYREVAPAAATEALNLKQLKAGAHGYLSAPVPGVVAGLNMARRRYGRLPLKTLLAPAIKLAREGHPYGARQALVLGWFYPKLRRDPVLRAVFGRGPGRKRPIHRGETLKQPSLANTLSAIANHDDAGFYQGQVARYLTRAMQQNGGLVTLADLKKYRPQLRQPLRFDYRGFEVLTMPPPSMGGIALLSTMRHLAAFGGSAVPHGSTMDLHRFIEAARRSYADRRTIGADPDMTAAATAPLQKRLLDVAYYRHYQPPFDAAHATPSGQLSPLAVVPPHPPESPDTTHFSVVDNRGNAVSCTTTLSAAYGARIMVPQTGVLLSNAMGAFSPRGVNALAPFKRMASSMTPTLVRQGGEVVAVLGSPGGDTIPNSVAQVLRNLIDHHMTLDRAIEVGRIHHQYLPDVVRLEGKRAPTAAVQAALRKLGHRVKVSPLGLGDVNGILVDVATGAAYGVADSRKGGLALGPRLTH